jgi:hypothetical protein
MCVGEGIALCMPTLVCVLSDTFFAIFSHAPGPVGRTVLIPLLKSGIPVEVEIPAPVKATKWLDFWIMSTRRLTFYSRTSGVSKYSFFSASVLCAVSILR